MESKFHFGLFQGRPAEDRWRYGFADVNDENTCPSNVDDFNSGCLVAGRRFPE